MTESVSTAVRTRWALSMPPGFIGLVCTPVAALFLLFTLIGIPLALVTVALYLALLLLVYVTAGIATGVIALQRWAPARTAQTWWRVAAAALGMGALLMQLRRPTVVLGGLAVGCCAPALKLQSCPSQGSCGKRTPGSALQNYPLSSPGFAQN